MTSTSLTLDYITRRMAELGKPDYRLRFRHLRLQPGEQRSILAYTDLFMLLEQPTEIHIMSDAGVFDLSLSEPSELQYEHQGLIIVTNLSILLNQVRFIQVIPIS